MTKIGNTFGEMGYGAFHRRAAPDPGCPFTLVEADMLILVIVLLVAWLIVSIIGFAMEGLVWLGIIGIVLFVGTAVIGAVRRKALRRSSSTH